MNDNYASQLVSEVRKITEELQRIRQELNSLKGVVQNK